MVFDYSLAHWLTFFTAAFLLNLSPGPDMAYILGQTIRGGVRSGFAAMFGIWSGAFIHVLLAALGLSAIVATSVIAFSIVKYIGAFYLIYIGITALRSKSSKFTLPPKTSTKSNLKIFKQGVLVATLNPKVAIFFLAFLPQFVEVGAGPISAQLFLHGFLIIVVAGFIEPPLVLMGNKLSNYLKSHTTISSWIDKGFGALLVGLGIELAVND